MDKPRLITHQGDLAWVHKPAGMATHQNAEGGEDLNGWLAQQSGILKGMMPVHRLDKDTSGVLLVGRKAARRDASKLFEQGLCNKRYLALVFGKLKPVGRISAPIDGKDAETELRMLAAFESDSGPLTLVELHPSTGRKHQLRQHLLSIRHPIVGDRRYKRRANKHPEGAPKRLWLHAASLALPDQEPVRSPLPPELAAHLERLRSQQ
ncbi:MAG: RNA pseudouridine synthase [Myxococcota bacterium]|nr:RNA pseudouridine synthase [Myxococcota bacterium]